MKTFTGQDIPEDARGIVYICLYNHEELTIEVLRSIICSTAGSALDIFANMPNPESQMAMGKTQEEFEKDLTTLHENMEDPEWVKELQGYL